MKIYTKTGDQGETSIGGGKRLPKDDLRIAACGEIDELNAVLGMCKVECGNDLMADILARMQRDLWIMGADLTAPEVVQIGGKNVPRILEEDTARLEGWIDDMDFQLPLLKNFILPGGSRLSAHLHLARTVCRRVERAVVKLAHAEKVDQQVLAYINRLSDLLFVMARYANQLDGKVEEKVGG